MKLAIAARSIGTTTVAFYGMVFCVFLFSSQAEAGCNSAIDHRSASLSPSQTFDPWIVGEPAQAGHMPCSGPSCSEAPASPPVPISISTPAVEPWAWHEPALVTIDPSLADWPDHSLQVSGEPVSLDIFHPPRF